MKIFHPKNPELQPAEAYKIDFNCQKLQKLYL